MALRTGHCKLHRDCSLQGPSWQNLCMQQQQLKEDEEKGNWTDFTFYAFLDSILFRNLAALKSSGFKGLRACQFKLV